MEQQPPDSATSSGELMFPFPALPEPGQMIEVAPGVRWQRIPLPMPLNHINLWAIEDGEGWTLVDAGMHTPQMADTWETILAGPMAARSVERVICTHMHPDHVGMASAHIQH
jgi:glyoxylase-like metal-dependent hydrolase (beta-lactamase superfamily II)